MSLKKNFVLNVILSITQVLFPLITFPYVTRILLPDGVGAVNFIDSIVQYIIIFAALGIPIYGVREIARARRIKSDLDKTFSELSLIHGVTSVGSALIFFIIALCIPELYAEWNLCLIGVGLILSNAFTLNWLYGGLEKFSLITIVSVSVRIITIIGIFILVKTPQDKVYYYGLNLMSSILTGIVNVIIATRYVSVRWKNLQIRKHLKPLYLLFSVSVISSIYVLLDSVILGFLQNPTEVGYYYTAMRISKIPISIMAALTSVMIPRITQMADNNLKYVQDLVYKSAVVTIMLSIPIALGMYCLGRELILLVAGSEFLPSLNSFRVLCFMIIPISFALLNYQILLPYNKENIMMKISIVGAIISIILNISLIPSLGGFGSAISSIITEVVVAVLLYFVGRNVVRLQMPWILILQTVVACSTFFILHYIAVKIIKNNLMVILSTVFACTASYFFFMIIIFKNQFLLQNISIIRKKFCK